jgi:preprotein translocase subunit Sss1
VTENIFNWTETAWNLIWGVGFVILILGLIYSVFKEFYSSSNIEKLKVIKITTFSILIIGIITFSYFYYQNRIFPLFLVKIILTF